MMKKIRSIEVKARDIPQDFLKKLGSHISQVGGLYVHTPVQLKKKSKTYLVKQVLRLEKLIVIITYNAYKMQLPRLKVTKRKALPYSTKRYNIYEKRVRKASPKQIAWRKKFAKMSKAGTLRKRRRR